VVGKQALHQHDRPMHLRQLLIVVGSLRVDLQSLDGGPQMVEIVTLVPGT
jgi:hypothetical protein